MVEFSKEELIIIALLLDEEEENKSKINYYKEIKKELCDLWTKKKAEVNLLYIMNII